MILINNGKTLSMAGKTYEKGCVLIDEGKIIEVREGISAPFWAENRLDI